MEKLSIAGGFFGCGGCALDSSVRKADAYPQANLTLSYNDGVAAERRKQDCTILLSSVSM